MEGWNEFASRPIGRLQKVGRVEGSTRNPCLVYANSRRAIYPARGVCVCVFISFK